MDKEKKKRFIFVLNKEFINQMRDLKSDNRVVMMNSYLKHPNNRFLETLQKVHTTTKINRKIKLPFKNIWKCSLRTIVWEKNVDYYVLFVGSLLKMVDLEYLKQLRESYDIKYILLLFDTWDSKRYSYAARYFERNLKFDYIFSFDPKDAKKYGFIYTYVPYSIISSNEANIVENDLYLVASVITKGGPKVFHSIYKYLKERGVSAHYRLVHVRPNEQEFKNEIIYNISIDYSEVIEGVKKSNCILEVLPLGQTGPTLRYNEAVCYNKKLLTTNKDVVNLPFYNPEYIHVFEKPEDIDCEWIKKRITIDYGYDGRFSPIRILDKIVELDEKMKEGLERGKK